MVSPGKTQSAGLWLILVVLLAVCAPICRADTESPDKAAKGNDRPNDYRQVRAPSLSKTEVRRILKKAGFPAKAIPKMLRIARCESALSATAEHVNRDGSANFGLFQIHESNWKDCQFSKAELADPLNNARCAYRIWQRQGYAAWRNCLGKP